MADDRARKLRIVRGLLDKANSTEFSEERDTFLAKADALMAEYAIEAFELEFAKPAGTRRKPEVREFTYSAGDHEVRQAVTQLFYMLANHSRCKIGFFGWKSSRVVGYKDDLDYLDLLFTNITLHMSVNLEPTKNPELNDFENVLAMKEAGLDWTRVFQLMGWPRDDGNGVDVAGRNYKKWKTQYKKFCEKSGRDYRTFGHAKNYRVNFIEGYLYRIAARVREMDAANERAAVGKEMVLAGMDDALNEVLWDAFPELRPHPKSCNCDNCHYRRCTDSRCKRDYCKAMRKPLKYRAASVGGPKIDYAAQDAGRRVANTADLSAGRNNVGGRKQALQ